MILTGATFWRAAGVEALCVRGGRIVAVGSLSELRMQAPGEEVRDLGGGFAVPGLADAHGHLDLLGESAAQLDLRGLASAEAVAAAVASAPRWRGVVRGRAWADAGWAHPPDARDLEQASRGDLVILERVDSHAVWVSSSVLAKAGIGRETVDPPGGRIERRPDGSPSGLLVDRAMALIASLVPDVTPAELDAQMLLAARRCARAGLTAIHDAGIDAQSWQSLLRLEAAGTLPVRVHALQRQNDPQADAVLAEGPVRRGRLHLRGVKFFVDGALGSRGAAFFEPYADGQGGCGLLLEEQQALAEQLSRRMEQGFQVALHAIGDRANHVALSAIAQTLAETGAVDARPRIEHAQHVRPADLPRFAAHGIIASMQPIHQASDWPWARARLGAARAAGAYAWRSMLRAGVALAFGSDFPIESEDPRLGLQAAIHRVAAEGEPDEALTPDQALRAFTAGAAYASFTEGEAGRFVVGARADFALFDRDPRTEPQARALATFLDGQATS